MLRAIGECSNLAQETNVVSEAAIGWDNHVLKAREQTAYVPIRLTAAPADLKSPAMYIRAVSRHDGVRASDEHSRLREWVVRGGDLMAKMPETIYISAGEMPFGLATSSIRQPGCPSWSWSPRLAGPLNCVPTKSTRNALVVKRCHRPMR